MASVDTLLNMALHPSTPENEARNAFIKAKNLAASQGLPLEISSPGDRSEPETLPRRTFYELTHVTRAFHPESLGPLVSTITAQAQMANIFLKIDVQEHREADELTGLAGPLEMRLALKAQCENPDQLRKFPLVVTAAEVSLAARRDQEKIQAQMRELNETAEAATTANRSPYIIIATSLWKVLWRGLVTLWWGLMIIAAASVLGTLFKS